MHLILWILLVLIPAGSDTDELPPVQDVLAEEHPLFYELLEADDDLIDRLDDDALTVFAPTDDGLRDTLAAADLTPEDLLSDPDALHALLAYHIVPASFDLDVLLTNDLTYIPTLLPERALLIQVGPDGDALFMNAVEVTTATFADNGVVYALDGLFIPPQPLVDIPEPDEPREESLGDLLDDADLISGDGPYTVFAPPEPDAPAIVPGRVSAETMRALIPLLDDNPFYLLTVDGDFVQITLDDDGVLYANGVPVIEEDLRATDGVLHRVERDLTMPDDHDDDAGSDA